MQIKLTSNHIRNAVKYCVKTRYLNGKIHNASGHRPVIVKRAVIGSKGRWKLSTIFLGCKVFCDWSMIKLRNILYLLNGNIFAVLFETTSHCFCLLSLLVWHRKKDLAFWYFFFSRIFLSCRVPTFTGQKVVTHGGHGGISFLFID